LEAIISGKMPEGQSGGKRLSSRNSRLDKGREFQLCFLVVVKWVLNEEPFWQKILPK
jgi:hypothetical protein